MLQAQRTFTGAGVGTDWSTSANWNPSEPGANDDVVFAAGSLTATITQAGELARILDVSNGATLDMTGGDITLRGLHAGTNADTGTISFIDGDIDINNNVAGESVQLGNSTGGTGTMTMGNGVTSPTLDYSGGRFEVGTVNGATASFTLESGTITTSNNQNLIIGQGNAASNSTVIVNSGSVNTGTADTNMNDGTTLLTMNDGSWTTSDLRFSNTGPSTTNLNGGTMTINATMEDRGGLSTLNMSGTALLEFAGSGLREVDELNFSGGTLRLGAFSETFQVFDTADISGPTSLELTSAAGGGPTRWIGGTASWVNGDTTKWDSGVSPDGQVSAGASFIVIGAGTLTNGSNLVATTPNWATSVNGDDLEAVSLVAFSGPTLTATFDTASANAMRNSDLTLGTLAGADAAGIDMLTGTLSVTGTNELIIGVAGAQGEVLQTGGTINVNDDVRYLNTGGIYRLRGGSLNVGGDLVEDTPGVNNAQFYIGGGFLNVAGDVTTQSFRTGETAGFEGFYFHAGGTLTNTGTFYAGNNALGSFTVGGGTVNAGATIISAQTGAQNSEIIMDGGVFNTTGNVDVGQRGSNDGGSFLLAGGGVFTASGNLRLGNNGGLGTIQVDNASGGGTVVANSNITTGGGGQGVISLFDGGTLVLGNDPGTRNITDLQHFSGGTLEIQIPADLTMTALNATGATNVDPGAVIDVQPGNSTGNTTDSVTWNSANGDWDLENNWLANDLVTSVLPAYAAGLVAGPFELTYLTASLGTILNPANVTANAGWSVVNPGGDMSQLALSRAGSFGQGPGLAIINNGSTVTRDSDLRISTAGGSDGAQVDLSGSSTLEVANASSDPDFILGGSQLGNVNQGIVGGTGASVSIDGNLLFGGIGGTQGGTYNLNGGTLNVGGDVIEGAAGAPNPGVNSALLQINGGTNPLSVAGGNIIVQRFAVGQLDGSNATQTLGSAGTIDITTSGTFAVGGGTDGGAGGNGTFTLGAMGTMNVVNANIAEDGLSTGVLNIDGSFVSQQRVYVAGDTNDAVDAGTTGTINLGATGSMTVVTGNTEIGRDGQGFFNVNGGSYLQKANNLVLGQSGNNAANDTAEGTVVISSGTVTVGDGDNGANNSDVNINDSGGTITQTGGDFLIERNFNMGSDAEDSSFTMSGGTLIVTTNLDCRPGAGTDTIALSGNIDVTVGNNLDMNDGSNNQLVVSGSSANIDIGNDALIDASASAQFVLDTGGASPLDIGGTLTLGGTLSVDVSAVNANFGTAHCLPRVDIFLVSTVSGAFSNVAVDAAVPGTTFTDGSEFILRQDASGLYLEPSGGINLLDDDDGDRILNLAEIGHGTDPFSASSGAEGIPTLSSSGGNLTISYRQLQDPGAITYLVEESDDLVNWFPLGTGSSTATMPTPSTVVYELTVSMAESRKFVRVSVIKP